MNGSQRGKKTQKIAKFSTVDVKATEALYLVVFRIAKAGKV